MTGKADSISDYIRAKDGNRPYLLDTAFAEDASLEMIVQTASVSFPPTSIGRDAIAETLVRRFNQQYENIFTLCIGIRPEILAERFSCQWMVVMSDRKEHCGSGVVGTTGNFGSSTTEFSPYTSPSRRWNVRRQRRCRRS